MCLLTYFLSKIIGTTKKGIRRVFGYFYEASLFDCSGSILVNLSPGEYKSWNESTENCSIMAKNRGWEGKTARCILFVFQNMS